MSKRPSLVYQAIQRLDSLEAVGVSRHRLKEAQRSAMAAAGQRSSWSHSTGRMHSIATKDVYKHHSLDYVEWAREKYGIRRLEDLDARADALASEWLQQRKDAGMSPDTLHTMRSALRMFHRGGVPEEQVCNLAATVQIPIRHREEIRRSRSEVAMDRQFQPRNHQQLIEFCRATGLRRREVEALKAISVLRGEAGRVQVLVENGKGGKARLVPVLPGKEQAVLDAVRGKSPNDKVFERGVPCRLDVHALRREYAQSYYRELSGRELPPQEGRLRPTDYDRGAAMRVSEALGHNRVDVILRNYLR